MPLISFCSFRKYPYPPQRRATEIPRGGGSKRRQFPRARGFLTEVSFSGGLGKIGELLINKSSLLSKFSVILLLLVFKQVCCLHCSSSTSTPWMEIPRGWGSKAKVPSVGGKDIFWNYTLELMISAD